MSCRLVDTMLNPFAYPNTAFRRSVSEFADIGAFDNEPENKKQSVFNYTSSCVALYVF